MKLASLNIFILDRLGFRKEPTDKHVVRLSKEQTREWFKVFAEDAPVELPKSQVLKTADLNKLLYQASKTDYSEVINLNVLRTMTQAYYSNKESSHFGLNLRKFLNFHIPYKKICRFNCTQKIN